MTSHPQKKNNTNYDLQNNTLYFLHIPKTAGTTLITILDSYFDSNSILRAHSWNELLPQIPQDFSEYKFVRGHFGYSITRLLKNPICITMLRDPTELVISAIKMLSRQEEDIARFRLPKDKTLSELVIGPYLEGLKNPQTHWLVIEQDIIARTKEFSRKELESYRPEEDPNLLPKISYENFLKIAKKRISEFAFVGLVEKMEESLFLLHYTFGWKPMRNKVRKNVSPLLNNEISDEAMKKLNKNTKIDQKLYRYGKNLFEERYSRMIKDLTSKHYEKKFDGMDPNDMTFEMLKKDYQMKTEFN
jgi:hypothetical protein